MPNITECHNDDRGCATTEQVTRKKRRRQQRDPLRCGVCGCSAVCFHFGGIACNSCKAFFRRAVKSNTKKPPFKCKYDGNCPISISTRKCCPACRYAKCRAVGMDPFKVRTTDDVDDACCPSNNRLVASIERMYTTHPIDVRDLLSDDDMSIVHALIRHFKGAVSTLPHCSVARQILQETRREVSEFFVIRVMFTYRVIRFLRSLLTELVPTIDKSNVDKLVHASLQKVVCLRTIYEFHNKRRCWPNDCSSEKYPLVVMDDYIRERMSSKVLQNLVDFSEKMQKLSLDEPCMLLLTIISIFTSNDGVGFTDVSGLDDLQQRFFSVLCKYVQCRYGVLNVSVVFPKLLSVLTDVQELMHNYYDERNRWLDDYEIDYLNKMLGKFNPFKNYSLDRRNNEFIPASCDPYDLLGDRIPSLQMIYRGAVSLVSVATSDKTEPETRHMTVENWSPDEFDLSLCNS